MAIPNKIAAHLNLYRKITKAETWWSEESPGVPLFCQWMQQFVEQSKYWHPKLPTIIFCFTRNDFVYEETPEKQKLKIWNYVWQQYLRKPNMQRVRYWQWHKLVGAIKKEGEYFLKNKRRISDKQFLASFTKVVEILRDHWRFTWVQESADIFTTYHLPQLIKKEVPQLNLEQATEAAMILTSPAVLSFMEHYRIDLLKFVIKYYAKLKRSGLTNDLQRKLRALAHEYIWLLSNYKEGRELTWQKVWEQIRFDMRSKTLNELKQELAGLLSKARRNTRTRVKLQRELRLSNKLHKACELLSWWSRWIDERKQMALLGNWYLEHYVQTAAQRLKIEPMRVKYMLFEEIIQGFQEGKILPVSEYKSRRKLSLYLTTKEHGRTRKQVITGKAAQVLWKEIFPPRLSKEIKGQVASAPVEKVEGVVQVILDPHKERFTDGRILVTTMTRPDFVSLMRRAKAIICDEGGITSHAAIISRELDIPCIIGTKVASKILRTGNRVELDLGVGTVQKLKH